MNLNREIVTPRAFALFGLVLIVALLVIVFRAERAEPTPPQPVPVTAVAVISCGHFVSVFITWPDGRLQVIDSRHPQGFEDTDKLKTLILSAGSNKVFEMDCTAVGHDSV